MRNEKFPSIADRFWEAFTFLFFQLLPAIFNAAILAFGIVGGSLAILYALHTLIYTTPSFDTFLFCIGLLAFGFIGTVPVWGNILLGNFNCGGGAI